jgi:hypothetical protein
MRGRRRDERPRPGRTAARIDVTAASARIEEHRRHPEAEEANEHHIQAYRHRVEHQCAIAPFESRRFELGRRPPRRPIQLLEADGAVAIDDCGLAAQISRAISKDLGDVHALAAPVESALANRAYRRMVRADRRLMCCEAFRSCMSA